MSFPGKLLKLSIKKQIIWTITSFSVIASVLMYLIVHLYIFEVKENLIKNYREYYFLRQKEIFQNIITFQNFFLFNYEDTIKSLICQIVLLQEISKFFKAENDFKLVYDYNFEKLDYTNKSYAIYNNESNKDEKIYFMFENETYQTEEELQIFIKMSTKILNVFKSFRIPYYGDKQLFDGVAIFLNRTKEIYSLNNTFLYNFINNEIDGDNFNEYYTKLTNTIVNSCTDAINKITSDKSLYPQLTINEELFYLIENYKKDNNIKIFSKYSPHIDYKKDLLHFIRIEDENRECFTTMKLRTNLIDELFLEMIKYFNITTLLMSPDGSSIVNTLSCKAFLVKFEFYYNTLNKINNFDHFKKMIQKNEEQFINKNITIDKCMLYSENKKVQEYFQKYILQEKKYYFDISGGYNSSFIKGSNATVGERIMVTRYAYPDLFLMERKKPKYLIPSFINIYSFCNFYVPFTYIEDKSDYLLINFLFITIGNLHFWIIIFVIIILICAKISRDITNPLIKLKKAIEQMSFNDETIFEYKDDNIINELFAMCKELVNKDEFKKSIKEKSFLKEKKLFEESENKKIETDEKNSESYGGGNRNLILNNQLFEQNKRISFVENKAVFKREIIEYKEHKFFLKSRPRTQTRKRPKLNKMTKKFDLEVCIKTFNRNHTKGDENINSIIMRNFARDSISSEISLNGAGILPERGNKNGNELNILFYELLFYLGKKMYKNKAHESSDNKSKYYKFDKSVISNEVFSGYTESSKNIKFYEDNNKFYNYDDPLFENTLNKENDLNYIYEEKKNIYDFDERKALRNHYKINFKKNNLYYKYLKAKNNFKNKFIYKVKKVRDLDLDINEFVQIDDDEDNISSIFKKPIKKNNFALSQIDRNNIFVDSKDEKKFLYMSSKKKGNLSQRNFASSLRKSISSKSLYQSQRIIDKIKKKPNLKENINMFQRSVSTGFEKVKKTKFNPKVQKNW